jgi:Transposase DDE domain
MTNKNYIAQLNNTTNFDIVKTYCLFDDTVQDLKLSRISDKGGRPPCLSFSDIALISLLKSRYGVGCWKQMYMLLVDRFSNYFQLPAYQNFVKAMNDYSYILILIINGILARNRRNCHKIKFIDSTIIPVCTKLNISSHKVMQDYATLSKSTTGWFFGLKLHTVIDYDNKPLYFALTTGKTDDRAILPYIFNLFDNSVFVADKGYQSQEKEESAKQYNHILLTGKKKSSKQKILASWFDIHLLHERARIEVVFSVLKERLHLINTLSRSVKGVLSHYVHTLFGYLLLKQVS